MVFLEKQYKGGKYYYYLSHSMRLPDGKFKKIRHFIEAHDNQLDQAEEKLLELEHMDDFLDIVETHKPLNQKTDYKHSIFFEDDWEIFSKENLGEITEIKKEFKRLQQVKNRSYFEIIREEFVIRHAYDTNRVEGSRFTFEETEALLTKGLVLEPHKQREIFEISNIRDAFDFIETYQEKLSNKFIKELHKEVTKNTLKFPEMEGKYRTKGINVKMGNNPYRTVPGEYVDRVMREAIKHFEEFYKTDKLGAIIRFYVAFIAIHPFLDGNGRTSRMLLNYLLMREGLPPINFVETQHSKHIKFLNQAMNEEGLGPITEFIMNRIRLNHWTQR